VIHQRGTAKAITKIKPRSKQIKEYRGFGTTNEKGDLTKERRIDKFSDQMGNLFNNVPMTYRKGVHLLYGHWQ